MAAVGWNQNARFGRAEPQVLESALKELLTLAFG
jgi:hypothetical protein